jgi:hypothetical protein
LLLLLLLRPWWRLLLLLRGGGFVLHVFPEQGHTGRQRSSANEHTGQSIA